MNWNKLILVSAVATAVVALPVASTQARDGRGSSRASFSGGSRSFAPRSVASRSFNSSSARANFANRGGNSRNWGNGQRGNWRNGQGANLRNGRGRNWANGRGGNWNNRHRWHGHRRHHHHRHYYPYYSYYPFGFGYPFWGASASLYYNGYDNGYYGNEYDGNGGSGASLVMNVQEELARAGYYQGEIDGVIGNGTRSAIRAYERANGLRVDGRIDSSLLSRMGLG